ncbi:MADS-box protein SVP [Bienertia sinuspersici]
MGGSSNNNNNNNKQRSSSSSSKMAREKIQIKKIDNITARQVTFSKRRRGIFKKAEELSVLCDADIALIIFSATGKLFDFSSTSRMKDILTRYTKQSKNEEKEHQQQPPQPFLEWQAWITLENNKLAKLNKELADKNKELRKLRGEDLQGVELEELLQLERVLEDTFSRVLDTKGKRIKHEIETLQKQGAILMEENKLLKQKMIALSQGKKPALIEHHHSDTSTMHEEGQSSESITNNGGGPLAEDDSSDTSLKLG